MRMVPLDELPLERRLAVTLAPITARDRYAALFALDWRLGSMLSRTREPLAAQLRLAWWRELLAGAPIPRGDQTITAICEAWTGRLERLLPMVDGWEESIAEKPDAVTCARDRADPFAALVRDLGGSEIECAAVSLATSRWLLVDMAVTGWQEAWGSARELPATAFALPRSARPLVFLDGLAKRTLRRNRGPLLGDRLSPLAALRLGIFGR